MKRIGITTGDPAGIGPEVVAAALRFRKLPRDVSYIVYGQADPLDNGSDVSKIGDAQDADTPGKIYWIEAGKGRYKKGAPSAKTGQAAYAILERCSADLMAGTVQAVVTAPVAKEFIRLGHPEFTGHTEYFAETAGVDDPVMTFRGDQFNLALLTTHLPVCEVAAHLDPVTVTRKLRLIWAEAEKFGNTEPLALLAHDPHAGETGGTVDNMFRSIVEKLDGEGIRIDGPFPADSFFYRYAGKYRWVVSASHDQGLIPFKMLHGGRGVNVTIGLPFVRASVDHGTAFAIAGKRLADEESMTAALDFAETALQAIRPAETVPYSHFARYYDNYMSHVAYDDWTELILQRYNRLCHKSPTHILELACGTASVACRFVARGIPTDAADASPEMLRAAYRKSGHPHLFRADMLARLAPSSYDLVVLTFDSINYLQDSSAVETLFERVGETLAPGGVFVFDISTLRNCKENFDGLVNIEEYPDCTMIHTSEMRLSKHLQETRLMFFEKRGYTVHYAEEVHRQRIYRVENLMDLITGSSLQLQGIWALEEPENLIEVRPRRLDDLYARLFFVLQKP